MRTRTIGRKRLTILIIGTLTLLISCQGPTSRIQGTWTETKVSDAKLLITKDTMKMSQGPMSFTFPYTLRGVDGDVFSVELDDGQGHKETGKLLIQGDTLIIRNNFVLNGVWKRTP
jgi:hypothetical protein